MNKSNLILASVCAIIFTSILIIFSPNSKKIPLSSPTPSPTLTDSISSTPVFENLTKKVIKSKIYPGWMEITGFDYTFSFPSNWQFEGQQSQDDYNGQSTILTSPDKKTRLKIGADLPFDLVIPIKISSVSATLNQKKYLANEISWGSDSRLLSVSITELTFKENPYVVLFGNDYPVYGTDQKSPSISDYVKNKSTVLQILSTFKFTEKQSMPSTPVKQKVYKLPSGWQTITESTGIFSVGYNPETQETENKPNYIGIISKNIQNDPYYSPYASTIGFKVLPYDNGSRHIFLEKQLGETVSNINKTSTYKEINMIIDGKNCLVLNGISISQFPTVWGMCVINSRKALLFYSFNYDDLSNFLSTLKFL